MSVLIDNETSEFSGSCNDDLSEEAWIRKK